MTTTCNKQTLQCQVASHAQSLTQRMLAWNARAANPISQDHWSEADNHGKHKHVNHLWCRSTNMHDEVGHAKLANPSRKPCTKHDTTNATAEHTGCRSNITSPLVRSRRPREIQHVSNMLYWRSSNIHDDMGEANVAKPSRKPCTKHDTKNGCKERTGCKPIAKEILPKANNHEKHNMSATCGVATATCMTT